MDERQDIYSGRGIEWRWVCVGFLVVLGMGTLLASVLAAFGVDLTSLFPLAGVSLLAFLAGGTVIGLLSPGYTAWEAGLSSLAASVAGVLLAQRILLGAEGVIVLLPIAAAWGLVWGLAGGRIGERLQAAEASRGG